MRIINLCVTPIIPKQAPCQQKERQSSSAKFSLSQAPQLNRDTFELQQKKSPINFSGNSASTLEKEFSNLKPFSAKRFSILKQELEPKLLKLGIDVDLNKYSVELANKILADERLYGNSEVLRYFPSMLAFSIKEESVHAQFRVIDKILSTPELAQNESVKNSMGRIILGTFRADEADSKIGIISKVFSDERLYKNKSVRDNLGRIIESAKDQCNLNAGCEILNKILSNEKLYNEEKIKNNLDKIIICTSDKEQADTRIKIIDKILGDKNLYNSPKVMNNIESIILSGNLKKMLQILTSGNISDLIDKVEYHKKLTFLNPELYVNGLVPSNEHRLIILNDFFNTYYKSLIIATDVLDKESINYLFRQRLLNTASYLGQIDGLSEKDLELLKKLGNCQTLDGKPLMPTQKIGFIDLLEGYNEFNMPRKNIEKMINSGKVDIAKLHLDLLCKIMEHSGISKKEIKAIPKEKLLAWNGEYIHLLSKELQRSDRAFRDIFRAGNFEPDFKKYLHDQNNKYGRVNLQTKRLYEELGLDYEKWINPPSKNEIRFTTQDTNKKRFLDISNAVSKEMNKLLKSPAKMFIKKQFPAWVKENKFVIPEKYLANSSKLAEFVSMLSDTSTTGPLRQVWLRATKNSTATDPAVEKQAQKTLTILNNLNWQSNNLAKLKNESPTHSLDFSIKMWDRIPQKDIYQGNYSTCCIELGGSQSRYMPHYIMNTSLNMIEIKDNKSGNIVGNALCYLVKTEDDKFAFIIDNIEINQGLDLSETQGAGLREAITDYAQRGANEITHQDYTPIFVSPNFNDLPCDNMSMEEHAVSFIGDIDCKNIYLDLFGGLTDTNMLNDTCMMIRLR